VLKPVIDALPPYLPTVPFPIARAEDITTSALSPLVSKNGAFRFSLLWVMFSIDTETGFKKCR